MLIISFLGHFEDRFLPGRTCKVLSSRWPEVVKIAHTGHRAKEKATSQGGVIKHEFTLYPGFTWGYALIAFDSYTDFDQSGIRRR